jgi:hypothetical protein
MMGSGNRANLTIGRAVNLVKSNFYGSIAQDMDKSTLGHPGKISFCFAERLDASPWPSLAVAKGFPEGATTVTIFAANAPLQVSAIGGKNPEDFMSSVAHGMQGLGLSSSELLVVINPELMAYVAEAGWSRERAAEFLYTRSQASAAQWASWHRTEQPQGPESPEKPVACVADPGRITVVPGGGAAGASVGIIAAWGGSRSVTKEVQLRR